MTNTFLSDESGAVTVDWVVLTAALVGLGLAVMAVVSGGLQDLSGDTRDQMQADNIIRTSFGTAPDTGLLTAQGDLDLLAGLGNASNDGLSTSRGGIDAAALTRAGNLEASLDGYDFDANGAITLNNDGQIDPAGTITAADADAARAAFTADRQEVQRAAAIDNEANTRGLTWNGTDYTGVNR
jgi:hypothetical protein